MLSEFNRALGIHCRGHQQKSPVKDLPESTLIFIRELILHTDQQGSLALEELIPNQVLEWPEHYTRRKFRRSRHADRSPHLPKARQIYRSLAELILQVDRKRLHGLRL